MQAVPAGNHLQFLSDNVGACIAHETRHIASSLGLMPVNTPVCSPQSNGMAESFVNTFKRDCVSRMDLTGLNLNNPRYIAYRPCPEMQGQDQGGVKHSNRASDAQTERTLDSNSKRARQSASGLFDGPHLS